MVSPEFLTMPGPIIDSCGSPGRYYAARVLKLALARVLMNYVVKMSGDSKGVKRNFHWRSAIIPKSNTALLFQKRPQN